MTPCGGWESIARMLLSRYLLQDIRLRAEKANDGELLARSMHRSTPDDEFIRLAKSDVLALLGHIAELQRCHGAEFHLPHWD